MEERHGVPAWPVDPRQVDAEVTAVQGGHQRRALLAAAGERTLEAIGEVLRAAEPDADAHAGEPSLRGPAVATAHDTRRVSQVNTTAEPMTAKASTSKSSTPPMTEAHGGTCPASATGRWSGGSWANEPAPSQTASASPSTRTSTSSSRGMITSRSPAASLSVVSRALARSAGAVSRTRTAWSPAAVR